WQDGSERSRGYDTWHNPLMKIGLIGLAKSGKTTLFNLLTGSSIATARYDSGRAELHTGMARVPDPRVDRLAALFKPRKTTYATFEVVDLAGETPLRAVALTPDEARVTRGFTFLSQKPILHCLNLDEKAIGEGARGVERFGLEAIAAGAWTRIGWVSAVIEAEVAQLAGD